MTGENNTKVYNNKTLLDTCMLVYIVCMLSGSDVFGTEEQEKRILLLAGDLIQQIENDSTMYKDFKKILTSDERFNIKYKKRCRCCDTGKIDFKETTICTQNCGQTCKTSLELHMDCRFCYNKTKNDIELSPLARSQACTNLDNFIIKNIKAPK